MIIHGQSCTSYSSLCLFFLLALTVPQVFCKALVRGQVLASFLMMGRLTISVYYGFRLYIFWWVFFKKLRKFIFIPSLPEIFKYRNRCFCLFVFQNAFASNWCDHEICTYYSSLLLFRLSLSFVPIFVFHSFPTFFGFNWAFVGFCFLSSSR